MKIAKLLYFLAILIFSTSVFSESFTMEYKLLQMHKMVTDKYSSISFRKGMTFGELYSALEAEIDNFYDGKFEEDSRIFVPFGECKYNSPMSRDIVISEISLGHTITITCKYYEGYWRETGEPIHSVELFDFYFIWLSITEAEVSCTCNELKNTATNTCEPMAQQTEIDLTTGLVYAYPDNNHDDADRCPPILAVPESDNVCPASPQQSNASVGNNGSLSSNPINCATGQKQYTDVDYQGFGLDALAYTRTYSTPNVNEPAIDGSANRAAQWLSQSAPSLAKRTFDDGAELYTFESGHGMKRVFFKAANSSAWQTNGLMTPIELSFDNNQPMVTLANDQRIRFRDDLTAVSQQDAQGTERYSYAYVTVNGEQKISRVANRFGRYLDYSYNTVGQLVALTDQDDVSVQYEYDNAGRLIKVIYPDATPLDVSDNPSKTYLYEHPTFTDYVTGIVNQDGTRLANIAYDASGKATLSELHNGAERVEVSYPEDGKAVVKFYRDTAANAYREEHYQYGKFRGRYRLTQKQITQCDNCALTTESWLYNDRELLTRHTSPEGIVTEYGYDTQDRKVSETHGVGTPEASTTTYTWNDTHNQIETITTATDVTTYTFDVDGNRLNTTVTPVQ